MGTSTANQGTLSYTAGTIIGSFERWIASGTTGTNITFPVGTSSSTRSGVINFNTITTGGSVIVQFVATAPGSSGLSLVDGAVTVYNTFVEGYWDFTTANSFASSNFNLELTGTSFTSFTISATTRLLTRTNSGSAWTANGSHVDASGSTAKRNNVTQLSGQFGFGDNTACTAPTTSAITGSTSVCASAAGVAYSVTNTPGSTYTWTITGGTQASGTNTNSITVNWGATGMVGTVQVVENNGCTNGAAVTASVTIHAIAVTSITGRLNVAETTTGEPYSVTNTAGHTYTWTIGGGTQASGGTTNSITVDWGAAGTGTVGVVANNTGCGNSSASYSISVNKYIVINSIATGNWNANSTWDCDCTPVSTNSVRVKNPHTVTIPNGTFSITNLIVDVGGTVTHTGNAALTISGDITVNGIFSGTEQITLSGASTATITGTGTISTSGALVISNGNKTTTATSALTRSTGTTTINSGLTVNNYSTMTFTSSVDGGNAASTWINEANSTLNIGSTFMSTGTLTATASENTVNYNASGVQSIKTPSSSTYYHLSTGGTSAKTLPADLTISGNVTMDGTSSIDVGSGLNYGLSVAGNWVNNSGTGAFVGRSGTVTFNGTSTISGTAATTFNNITISNTLTGASSGNFSLTGTWTNNGTFTHNGGTVTFNGSTAGQSLTGSSSTAFNNLTISNTNSQVTISTSNISVASTLTMSNGNLDLNGRNIDLSTTGAVSGEANTKRILGTTGEIQISRTLASSTTYSNIAGLGINITTTGTAPGVTTIYRGHAPQTGDGNTSIKRYFTITPTTNSGLNATLRIYYFDNELNLQTSDANMSLYKANSPFTTWTTMNGTWTDAADDYVELNSIDGFSRWTISNKNNNPLPVSLLSFDAVNENNSVRLSWNTQSEINNDYFTVERGSDGLLFNGLATVNGAGNSNTVLNYETFDLFPLSGTTFYRLKQTDFNGNYEYSKTVSVNRQPAEILNVYPNPFSEGQAIQLDFDFTEFGIHVIELQDMYGNPVYKGQQLIQSNNNTLSIPQLYQLPSGVYLLSLSKDAVKYRTKLLKR